MKNTTNAIQALQQARPLPAHTRGDAARLGFIPAYLDFATMEIYTEDLPNEVVAIRSPCGRIIATKATLVAGYERRGYFFTLATVVRATEEWHLTGDLEN